MTSAPDRVCSHEEPDLLIDSYDELRTIARRRMRAERRDHTLQPTALVHEALLRMASPPGGRWAGRGHLLATFSLAIRRVLLDRGRRRGALRRLPDSRRTSLEGAMEAPEPESGQEVDPEALEEALETLARLHPRHAEVVRLRFFEGLTGEQTGLALGVSPRTVDGDWKMARAWLRGHLDYGCAE